MTKLNTDTPLSKIQDDQLSRVEFAKRLALILSTKGNQDSLVVGLYGKWGEGKSTVMNFTKSFILKSKDIVVLEFNPWQFKNEDLLMVSFFEKMAFSLNKSFKGLKERAGDLLKKYSDVAGIFTQYIGYSTESLKNVGEGLSQSPIEKHREKIDKLILESKKKIVVFIDDIDRLSINEVQTVFKLVKLIADFPNTKYVLAFDDKRIAKMLSPLYGESDANAGYEYLEKIIQVPLRIPQASKYEILNFTLKIIEKVFLNLSIKVKENEFRQFSDALRECFLINIDNPRIAWRFANSITFSVPLLYRKVNLDNLLVLEGIKIFYPELYSFIKDNREVFLRIENQDRSLSNSQGDKDRRDSIKKALDAYPGRQQHQLKLILLELFPQLKTIFNNYHFRETTYKKWFLEKRLCSGSYFERYFTYSESRNDMDDVLFDKFIDSLKQVNGQESDILFNKLLKKYGSKQVVFQLQYFDEDLDRISSEKLIRLLAINSKFFEDSHSFLDMSTYSISAIIIASLLMHSERQTRLQSINQIIEDITDLKYSMEIFYKIVQRERRDGVVVSEFEEEIAKTILKKFFTRNDQEIVKDFNLLDDGDKQIALLNWSKFGIKEKLFSFTKFLWQGSGAEAVNFLRTFTPTITTLSRPDSPYKSNFNAGQFNSLKSVTDIHELYQLIYSYKGDLSSLRFPDEGDSEEWSDNHIICAFQNVYKNADVNSIK